MDALTQYLALRDGVSAPLSRMTDAAEGLYESQEAAAQAVSRLENKMNELRSSSVNTEGAFSNLTGGMKDLIGQFAIGNIAAAAFISAASFVAELPGRIMAASDAYAGMLARLNLVTGSEREAAQMNEMIYQSALRARGSYEGMADSVSKIAMTAKEAFPDPKEVVPFVEGIQKLFAVGGTGIQQQSDAMLQLTQALGSGKLQGDEFRSIAEAAPLIEQMVARQMGVTQGELKQLSSQGVITADVLRDAILQNLDEINADFEKMPLTWGQIWQRMGTVATHAMAPVYKAISGFANSDLLLGLLDAFSVVMPVVGNTLGGIVDFISSGIQSFVNVLSYAAQWGAAVAFLIGDAFEAVFPLIAGGLAMVLTYLTAVNGALAIEAGIQMASAAATTIATAAKAAWVSVTNLQATAMAVLNAVLNANPIILVARLALLAVGAFAAWQAGTLGLKNTIASSFQFIADIAESVINFIIARINNLISAINFVARGLNSLTGSNISTIGTIQWRAENWREKAYDAVQNFNPAELMAYISGIPGGASIPDTYAGIAGGTSDITSGALEGPAARETADNTRGILDAMGIMDEDIKFFRDMAEQDVINRYTTASVNINVENTNNIASDVDAEGMVVHLIDQLAEAEQAGAEAVHI